MKTVPAARAQKTTPLTLELMARARAIRAADLPGDVRELARLCMMDWIGVTLAGSHDPLTRMLLEDAQADGGHAVATIVGHAVRLAPLQAALVNGAASHILDYDDVNLSLNGHPGAAILPALLALAQARESGGDEVVAAFVAGYETACRAGLLVAPGHYLRGYHATATVGALGAAAACARLLDLDTDRAAHAIGIAATEAGGLKSMFGTQCKPFHAGLAAQNGLRAARLAAAGVQSRTDALECRQGFADTMSPDFNPEAALDDPLGFHIRDNLFKYHASCYGTHAAIECVRQLRESEALTPEDVERVEVRVERGSDAVCNIPAPRTALEAKFSLRFMTAAALAGADTSDLAFFTDARTADPALCALREKVAVALVTDWPKMQAEVIVETRDGRVLRAVHDAGVPATNVAAQAHRVSAKFERLSGPVLGPSRSRHLMELLGRLDSTNASDLMRACAKD